MSLFNNNTQLAGILTLDIPANQLADLLTESLFIQTGGHACIETAELFQMISD